MTGRLAIVVFLAGCGSPAAGPAAGGGPAGGDDGGADTGCTPQVWFRDADGDGHGDPAAATAACAAPADHVATGDDCDDSRADVSPDAREWCDGATDEDCDGQVDEDGAADAAVWARDADGDGWGDPDDTWRACTAPAGYVPDVGDCDDSRADVNPSAAEVCDSAVTDEDCDGSANEPTAVGAITLYLDGDGDGYGDPDTTARGCEAFVPWIARGGDCDDGRASVNPGAPEICEGMLDEDCDGTIDEDDAVGTLTWYADADGDGFGDVHTWGESCRLPAGAVGRGGDCDDARAVVNPDAMERCGAPGDEDCDGLADCDDSECTGAAACAEATCDDGLDEDGDGLVDCEDADCAGDSACLEASCDDGLDEDGDGLTDCADEDCWGTLPCGERVRVQLTSGRVDLAIRDASGVASDRVWLDARSLSGAVTRWVSSTRESCTFTAGRASFSGARTTSGAADLSLHQRSSFALSSGCGITSDVLPTGLRYGPGPLRARFPGATSSSLPAWYGGTAGASWATSSTVGFAIRLAPQSASFQR